MASDLKTAFLLELKVLTKKFNVVLRTYPADLDDAIFVLNRDSDEELFGFTQDDLED